MASFNADHMRRKLLLVLCVLVPLAVAVAWSFRASPLPAPEPWSGQLPEASPPAGMAIYQLPTGTYQTPAALAYRGGSFSDTRDFVATAILVRHPQGDLLFDAGFGADIDAQLGDTVPGFARSTVRHDDELPVRAQLEAAGYDLDALRGVVVTHAHWDHVGGVADLHVPVWMTDAELTYAREDHAVTEMFNSFSDIEIHTYGFDGPPYLGFPASYDVWGDGSVVLVPAPGHTPGSIVAFVNLPHGTRYALIGDLTWQLEGIELRAERPIVMRMLADVDAEQVRENLRRMLALDALVQIVPAHDGRAHAAIPRLPGS
jgi:N-acyl homoserine lactone hydrolase